MMGVSTSHQAFNWTWIGISWAALVWRAFIQLSWTSSQALSDSHLNLHAVNLFQPLVAATTRGAFTAS